MKKAFQEKQKWNRKAFIVWGLQSLRTAKFSEFLKPPP